MAENERDALNDLEFEITDLDPAPRRRAWSGVRWTPGRRRWSVVVTSVVFVLLVGLFLGSISDVRGLLAQTLFQSTSAVPANSLGVYLQGNPSWGKFSLDGKPIAHLPVVGRDQPLVLSAGRHTVAWQIAPLQAQSCVFTVRDSATIDGPCLHNGLANESSVLDGQDMLLSFFASARYLPAAPRAALVKQLQAFVATYGSSELVRSGELYAVSDQQTATDSSLCTMVTRLALCAARATQPLQATLHVQLDDSTSPDDFCILSTQCYINGQDCRQFCTDPFPSSDAIPLQGWNVAIALNLSWTYTTLSGQTVASNLPDSAIRSEASFQIMSIQLIRTNSGGWRIIPFPDSYGVGANNPNCDQAVEDADELVNASATNEEMFAQQAADFQGAAAWGCLVVLKASPSTSLNPSTPISGTTSSQVAYCLVRFGVVLAINHFAQQAWPFLPLADSYESGLAQTLIATLPVST